jgi:hypothetical protein
VIIPVTTNDSDPDGNPLEIVFADLGAHGITEFSQYDPANTAITYLPDWNFSGNDSFTYILSDGRGGTSVATVFVSVVAGNDPPVANDDTALTLIGTPVSISVLANDTDPDGNPLSVVSVTQPANGTTAINANGTITYTPNAGFTGVNTFNYTITDNIAGNDSATVTVTVHSGLAITAINPSTVRFGYSTLYIDGTGFASGATLSFANGEGKVPLVSSLTVQSSTRIVATINCRSGGPNRPRYWDVTVRNPNGTTATLVRGLTVVP